MEVLVMTLDKQFYDENYDLCQESEDDWVTDIIGSEDQLIGELLNND